jgi:hypothetical protein
MTRDCSAPQPGDTSAEGSGVGNCRRCGHESRGTYDGYFRHAEFTCEQCGHAWTATLTDKQRWDLLHDREPGRGPMKDGLCER